MKPRQPTEAELAWAAGFFDGEGCVSILARSRGSTTYFWLQLVVFQNRREPLDELHALFGGRTVPSRAGWIWRANGDEGQAALTEMRPYLRVKHAQADVAIAFQGRRLAVGERRSGDEEALDARDYWVMRNLKTEA